MMDASSMTSSAVSTSKTAAADAKIRSNLATLEEKMELCDAMLNPGAGDPKLSWSSEAMLAVVGYLEACAPRMVELVEAAASGALSEEVFAECLAANDRLQKQLADVETSALTETSASTTAASAPPSTTGSSSSVQEQFEDLLLSTGNEDTGTDTAVPAAPPAAVGGAKSTGEEEDDWKQPAVQPSGSGDEFDSFFTERTTPS